MATRTISDAGGNFNAVDTWVEGIIPTSADDIVATATSGQLTINTVIAACLSIDFTNYTNTFTISASQILTVSGNVKFVAAMTIAGTGTLTINATSTLTSAGITLTGNLTLAGTSQTYTLADDWTVSGALALNGTTAVNLTGAFNMYVGGNLSISTTSTGVVSATIILNGTGIWSGGFALRNNLTINTSGTITISTNIAYGAGTLTYTAGTVNVTGGILSITAGNTTLNTGSNIIWSGLSVIASITITLLSDLYVAGAFSTAASVIMNSNILHLRGNIAINSSLPLSGTTDILVDGTGSQTWTSSSGTLKNNITINCSGTLSITGNIVYNTGTFTYTAGTVNVTAGTITIGGGVATTLATNGISWNQVQFSAGSTIVTLTNDITCVTFFATSSNVTSNGSIIYTNGLQINANLFGTTNIEINGTGVWNGITGYITNNININCVELTLAQSASTNLGYRTGTLTYTAGTVITTGITLNIGASTTLNTNGINWDNISITTAATLTLNSLLTVLGTLTLPNANLTFAGTAGFTVGTLTNTSLTLTRTYTFVATKTYIITNSLTFIGTTAAVNLIFVSSSPGTTYNFTLQQGASHILAFLNVTDADSDNGQTIWCWSPTLSNTMNWNPLNYIAVQSASSFG